MYDDFWMFFRGRNKINKQNFKSMVMVTLGGVESQSVELELVSVDYPKAYYINENLATMNPQVGL